MRPSELMLPVEAFNEKKPFIYEQVFFVPESEDKLFEFPDFSHETLFGNTNPVVIEYCSGNGTWIAAKARENPMLNFVAVEQKVGRGKQIWSKIRNYQLSNLIVLIGEGESSTKRFFQDNSFHMVYVNFPDPWPKRRHAKNRIINPSFVAEMARVLQPEGGMVLVTDDQNYSNIMIETVLQNPSFESHFPHPHYISDPKNYGGSFFDTLWREKGKEIRLHQFQKRDNQT